MHHALHSTILLGLIMLLLPLPAQAIPTITCHCFTDRSYDAAHPAAADAYLLATTQNSFFAIVFNTDKKTIVLKKQQGTSPDDLWLAYWLASKTAVSAETLLQSKQRHETWRDVLAAQRVLPSTLGGRFTNALNTKPTAAALAEAAVDELFLSHHLLPESELRRLAEAGTGNGAPRAPSVSRTLHRRRMISLSSENR